jgi:hypothetical protein
MPWTHRAAFVGALLAVSAIACGGDGDDARLPDGGVGSADAGDGGAPDASVPTWSFADVHGLNNVDDDDDDAVRDWDQAPFAADDDVSRLVLPGEILGTMPAGARVRLTMAGHVDSVKIWDGDALLLGEVAGPGPLELDPRAGGIALVVGFGRLNRSATLTIDHVDEGGAVVESAVVALRSSPLILNHHLQAAEHLWAVRVNGNSAFIDAYRSVLGDRFTAVAGPSYGNDVWIQDEIEFAAVTGSDGQRLDVVIDSIRDRGLDPFAESELAGSNLLIGTWGDPADATTYDSFGNLEVSPPVAVDGVEYPAGRIYYGRKGSEGLDGVLAGVLADQALQQPIRLDTTWLCVGHVDEVSSFVPDPGSPRGFKLLLADTRSAWSLLEAQPAAASLGRFGPDHGYPTVGSLLADGALVALNDDLQVDYLDPMLAQLKANLGLTDDDIILVPSLFEQVGGCGGRVAALVPGMVNLIVANFPGEPVRLFVPDPFFRAGDAPSGDPFRESFVASMPAASEIHFVDNWDVYHLGLGEVHCGTNVRRTPSAMWWAAALPLGGE